MCIRNNTVRRRLYCSICSLMKHNRVRKYIQFNNSISGCSTRNIFMCSGVKSLGNHRKHGGAFRTNLTKAFCGTGMLGEAPNLAFAPARF